VSAVRASWQQFICGIQQTRHSRCNYTVAVLHMFLNRKVAADVDSKIAECNCPVWQQPMLDCQSLLNSVSHSWMSQLPADLSIGAGLRRRLPLLSLDHTPGNYRGMFLCPFLQALSQRAGSGSTLYKPSKDLNSPCYPDATRAQVSLKPPSPLLGPIPHILCMANPLNTRGYWLQQPVQMQSNH